jgi:hypothetical protein
MNTGVPKLLNTIGNKLSETSTIKIFMFIAVLVSIILSIVFLTIAIRNKYNMSTPDNIKRKRDAQVADLETRWTGITQSKNGIDTTMSTIPDDQRLLINTNVLSTRLTGFLGPYSNGVFDEDAATRLALSAGSRCLVIDIDRETGGSEPKLIYRDGWGIKQSLNMASLEKVAKSIAGRAFKASNDSVPPKLASNPLFVVLYISNAPDAATQPLEYVRFLGKIAEALQPIRDLIVGQTPQGDFRRQALESQIFFQPYSIFSNKIIVLCNADTTPFRRLNSLGLSGEIGPRQDLDLFVHARLFSKQSPSNLGITSSPTSSTNPAAFITTPDYWLTIPPDRLADAQSQTKKAWTLVMQNVSTEKPAITSEQLTRLTTQYGVQSIPFTIFDDKSYTDIFTGKGAIFEKQAWAIKPELLRFIPPKPIVVQKASPQTNANGGFIVSPSL